MRPLCSTAFRRLSSFTMSTQKSYDIIVVGGGPAGSAAAIYAQRSGLQTLVLERGKFPKDKICGDAISGKSVAILHDLGLLGKVRALQGATVSKVLFGSPAHRDLEVDLGQNHHDLLTGQIVPMEAFVIRREIFDNLLFSEMRQQVPDCFEEFQVKDLIIEDGHVCGVRGRQHDGEITEFRASLVLGCDGFNSVVARQTGLYKHESRHWLVALRCYYDNVADLRDTIELHYVRDVVPGYFWIFPLENGQANVGIGMVHKFLKKRRVDLKEALQQVICSPAFAHRFANAKPLEEPVGWNLPAASKRRKISGNGFLLLGDAASLIDPFTGEGIGNALYSAKVAIEKAVEARHAGDFSARFLRRYDEELWNALGDELRISTRMQQLARWQFLLNLVIDRAASNKDVSDLISGMIANAVPRKQFANPLFYLKLLFR